jgi:hypothetical protein
MFDAEKIEEIIATYKKYGWMLRRVLLTKASCKNFEPDKNALFADVPIAESAIDAAWFSRPPKPGAVSWELRYLGDIQYALLENLDENDPEFENILHSVDQRLHDALAAKIGA